MIYLLVDNGSLRPESILNLRKLACEVSRASGLRVEPASLLHSSKVPAEKLEGVAAVNFERRLRLGLEAGERAFTVIPFFFGPTAAITDYMAERIAYRRGKHGAFSICRTAFLAGEADCFELDGLVSILASRIRAKQSELGWVRPHVALVDHGSPREIVTEVRECLAERLRGDLEGEVGSVRGAAMERRPGPEYAFNEPLLERLLRFEDWREREVIVAMQFLSPGRHAGPDGDVAQICREAEIDELALRTAMTDLVGTHSEIVQILLARLAGPRVAL